MMKQEFRTLAGAGITAAILWRVELDLHGWEGLDWIGYFHWAIPSGIALFLGWLFLFTPIESRLKRGALVLTTASASVIWFLVVQFALFYHFNGGPSAFISLLVVDEKSYQIYTSLVYAVVPLTPLLFAGLIFAFGLKPRATQLALAVMIYIFACPISIAILAVLHHRGGADALHTIKSGVIIPFLVIGLGVLLPKNEERRPEGRA